MQAISDRTTVTVNPWSVFTDVAVAMLLLMVFFIVIQFIANSRMWAIMERDRRQTEMANLINSKLGSDSTFMEHEADGNLQRLRFQDAILFDPGRAELMPIGRRVLRAVGECLRDNSKDYYDEILIEGHTDIQRIRQPAPYLTNWELSSARATAVVRYFVDVIKMKPWSIRLSAVGKSKFVMRDADNLSKNRRIEVVLVYSEKEMSNWLNTD